MTPRQNPRPVRVESRALELASLISTAVALSFGIAMAAAAMLLVAGMLLEL